MLIFRRLILSFIVFLIPNSELNCVLLPISCPYGTLVGGHTFFYQHHVPTGLCVHANTAFLPTLRPYTGRGYPFRDIMLVETGVYTKRSAFRYVIFTLIIMV